MKPNRVIFFIFNNVHLLDLAGAVTVFYESGCCGKHYDMRYVSPYDNPESSSGLGFTNVEDNLKRPGPEFQLRQQ